MITQLQATILYELLNLIDKNCYNIRKAVNEGEDQHICDSFVCKALNKLAEQGLITKHNRPTEEIQILRAGRIALNNFWYSEERYK